MVALTTTEGWKDCVMDKAENNERRVLRQVSGIWSALPHARFQAFSTRHCEGQPRFIPWGWWGSNNLFRLLDFLVEEQSLEFPEADTDSCGSRGGLPFLQGPSWEHSLSSYCSPRGRQWSAGFEPCSIPINGR